MAVPAHDARDYEFASKYDIPIRWVVTPDDKNIDDSGKAFPGEGMVINSSSSIFGLDINGLSSKEAASKVIEWAEKSGKGKKQVVSQLTGVYYSWVGSFLASIDRYDLYFLKLVLL